MKIGIDIGGTNTDAVLVDKNKKILGVLKEPTTISIEEGVSSAISKLLAKKQIAAEAIEGVYIGSTHATNAILERKNLMRVGLIRVAGHVPDLLPGFSWPEELRMRVIGGFETIQGGYECDGSVISKFDANQARGAIERLLEKGVEAFAVVGVFAPMNGDHERRVEELIREVAGNDFPVTLSSQIGGIGYIERENATIMNSALKKVVQTGFQALEKKLRALNIVSPLFMIHNDGSLLDIQHAIDFPIFTISAGQTNSFRGGVALQNIENAIVIDIGGTSADIGLVENGFSKRSLHAAQIGGVKLQFAMPDVMSLPIGGGTIVRGDVIGPDSVAKALLREAQCFGGLVLTLTDVAIKLGLTSISQAESEKVQLDSKAADLILQEINRRMHAAVQVMRGKKMELPVLAVGGGAVLYQGGTIPQYGDVANAYGAVLAEVSSTVDVVTSLLKREEVIGGLKDKAVQKAVEKGACPVSTRIVNMEIIPYAYSREGLCRVIVTASGRKAQ